jgi:hypothetical protein
MAPDNQNAKLPNNPTLTPIYPASWYTGTTLIPLTAADLK